MSDLQCRCPFPRLSCPNCSNICAACASASSDQARERRTPAAPTDVDRAWEARRVDELRALCDKARAKGLEEAAKVCDLNARLCNGGDGGHMAGHCAADIRALIPAATVTPTDPAQEARIKLLCAVAARDARAVALVEARANLALFLRRIDGDFVEADGCCRETVQMCVDRIAALIPTQAAPRTTDANGCEFPVSHAPGKDCTAICDQDLWADGHRSLRPDEGAGPSCGTCRVMLAAKVAHQAAPVAAQVAPPGGITDGRVVIGGHDVGAATEGQTEAVTRAVAARMAPPSSNHCSWCGAAAPIGEIRHYTDCPVDYREVRFRGDAGPAPAPVIAAQVGGGEAAKPRCEAACFDPVMGACVWCDNVMEPSLHEPPTPCPQCHAAVCTCAPVAP